MKKAKILSVTLLLVISFGSIADVNPKNLKIIGNFLDQRFEHDESSPYQVLLRKLSYGYNVEIGVYPVKRSTQTFIKDRTACIGPSAISTIKKFFREKFEEMKLIESDSIEFLTTRIFSKRGSAVARSLKDIEGKKVVSWLGIPDKLFLPGAEFDSIKVKSDSQALKILNAGRADFLLGFIPDTPMVAEKMKIEQPLFDANFIIFSEDLTFVCHDTPRNRKYLKEFNKKLAELKNSGELQKILGPYSVVAK